MSWVPPEIDVTVPNAARIYDYALGGVHNFQVDREFWDKAAAAFPLGGVVARANRAFLGRAVRRLAEAGISQFLDIGSGIPTLGNVHEVAHEVKPDARIVYADIDPIAVQQSRALLAGNPYALVVEGDLRKPERILYHPEVVEFLDFSEPIAVLTVAVLHFVQDADDPAGIVRELGSALVSGSYLVLSHAGPDDDPAGRERQEVARRMYENTPTPLILRSADDLAAILGEGFTPVEPGIVSATQWHPDPTAPPEAPQPTALVAVARKA